MMPRCSLSRSMEGNVDLVCAEIGVCSLSWWATLEGMQGPAMGGLDAATGDLPRGVGATDCQWLGFYVTLYGMVPCLWLASGPHLGMPGSSMERCWTSVDT